MDKVTRIAGHASRPIVTPRVSPTRGAASQRTVDAAAVGPDKTPGLGLHVRKRMRRSPRGSIRRGRCRHPSAG